jgi:hypothetical protein
MQVHLPDPLYRRLKQVAAQRDWSLAEVVRRAVEQYVERFPQDAPSDGGWEFPTIDFGDDFLADPATVHVEAGAIENRAST